MKVLLAVFVVAVLGFVVIILVGVEVNMSLLLLAVVSIVVAFVEEVFLLVFVVIDGK